MTDEQMEEPARLADLCIRAVERCGSDWGRVKAFLASSMDDLPNAVRAQLSQEIHVTLSFQPPMRLANVH